MRGSGGRGDRPGRGDGRGRRGGRKRRRRVRMICGRRSRRRDEDGVFGACVKDEVVRAAGGKGMANVGGKEGVAGVG